ncbi:uncharacterized protein SAPINGB_P005542 [Magnusiomyces paraingens]|uniref:Major facilitator superfamily (MFS) profile domain-containing protein n=1 Tax=Magnusiomyces paraingens TaxID=2606893 RepID=A0A5E8C7E2_9ASCO|nr:uncharacterized protein SAPINGB_P005542 [Saprochaete ingens]VVT57116.1 unnamed protein product [Saprochaete ingens]
MTSILFEPAESLADDFAQQTVFHNETQALNPTHHHHHHHNHGSTQLLLNSTPTTTTTNNTAQSNYNSESDSDNSDDDDDDDDDNTNPISSSKLKTEFLALPPSHRPSYNILFLGFTIYVTSFFAIVPSIMDAMVYMICRHDFSSNQGSPLSPDTLSSSLSSLPSLSSLSSSSPSSSSSHFNDPRCFAPEISAAVGLFQSYQTMISAIFGTITIPMLSSLSDRVGRKPLILWTVSCSLISLVITIACSSLQISYKYILLGAAIEGLGGSTTMISILASSYISDCVKEKHRAPILSISEAMFYGSMALGPFLGSLFLSFFNHKIPLLFGVSVLAQFFFLVLVYFALPESRSARARRNSVTHFNNARRRKSMASVGSTNNLIPSSTSSFFSSSSSYSSPLWDAVLALRDSLVLPLKAFGLPHIPRSQPRTRLNVYILLATSSMLLEVIMCIMPILFLYVKTVFSWTSVETGYFVSIIGISKFFGLAVLFPPLLRYLRKHYDHSATRVDRADKLLLRCGIFILATLYLLLAEAPSGHIFLALSFGFVFAGINSPVLRNALIKHAERGRVGELLGLSQFISRAVSVVLPLALAGVYNASVGVRPQLALEVSAAVVLIIFVVINFMSVDKEGDEDGV